MLKTRHLISCLEDDTEKAKCIQELHAYAFLVQNSVSDILLCPFSILFTVSSFSPFSCRLLVVPYPCSCPIYCFTVLREQGKPQQLSQCASNYMARNWLKAECLSSTHLMKGE